MHGIHQWVTAAVHERTSLFLLCFVVATCSFTQIWFATFSIKHLWKLHPHFFFRAWTWPPSPLSWEWLDLGTGSYGYVNIWNLSQQTAAIKCLFSSLIWHPVMNLYITLLQNKSKKTLKNDVANINSRKDNVWTWQNNQWPAVYFRPRPSVMSILSASS